MRFGVNTAPRGLMVSREAYMTTAQSAERLGYDFLSVSDHVVVPRANDSDYPYAEDAKWTGGASGFSIEMLTALTFLVGCTERIKLLSSVMVVPHRPALLTAKMLASMDLLSNGRMRVGVGAGWLREEFEALETRPFDARGKVTDEFIEAMKVLWTQDAPSYAGEHVRFSNVVFLPKPIQKPHPPIWVGGESAPALRRTVKLGDVWYPGAGNPKWRLDTPERLKSRVAKLHEFAEKENRDPASIAIAYLWFNPVSFEAQPGHDTARRMFSGRAEDMVADVAALKEVGVSHINLTFGGETTADMQHTMQRFADEVMPLVGS
ncbi:MAG: TIGR03619 family F420-dependent LLM class oxidoreductase [Hyphomicrobiaceae bacterium]